MIPLYATVRAARAQKSFRYFFEHFAWPVLLPARQFYPNWHIDAICEHLEAVHRGEIEGLIINMPFRHLKSTLVSQAFPAWVWLNAPQVEFLTASYAGDLATRDAVESRRIIEHPLYREAFGDIFTLVGDQNVKTRYENDKRGKRTVTSPDSRGVGFGGDIQIADDPNNPKKADSAADILSTEEWWKGSFSTRANDPTRRRRIIVQQRVNINDLTGYLLETDPKSWTHLVLPFRYDSKHPKANIPTSIGWRDPRTVDGTLIHPERIDEATAKKIETELGSYHVKAQLQQNPDPRGGIIFMRDWWHYWKELPEINEIVISVDCTFKDAAQSDHVAIQAWGSKWGHAHNYLLPGRIKERMGFNATVTAVRNMVALHGKKVVAVLIEDKANGPAVVEQLQTQIPGVIPIEPAGGKAARAYATQPTFEAGNVYVPDASIEPNIESFIGTCARFTGAEGGDDDEVDAMTQYLNWRRARNTTGGLFDLMRQQKAEQDAA